MAFEPSGMMLPIDQLLPLRKLPTSIRSTEKYKCIAASIREVGLIEPLIVYPQPGQADCYVVLDGTVRLDVLKCQNVTEAFCLIGIDNEAYTYNHKVNQLTPIQEHFMIMKAIEHKVPEERIASTLNVDVSAIRRKMNLLDGICPEAVALLKNRKVSAGALREVKRVTPMRQIEMAELMISFHNFSASYAKCLYFATPQEQRLPGDTPPSDDGVSPEDQARMEREMMELRRNFKVIEETHGENVLHLTLATGYLKKLLNNARIVRHLSQRQPEILTEFQNILEKPELGDTQEAGKE
jgi:ParB-like chromosome segregation protein Spo0J